MDIVTAARQAIGTPFRHQGRSLVTGLDCVGFGAYVLDQIGAPYVDQRNYGRLPANGRLEAALDAQPCLVRVATPEPGDFLLMRFLKAPQHLAIYAGATIIHAWDDAGMVCEHTLDATWRARIVRVYRVIDPWGSEA
jgi:cell wall-associated NlpC family hydrolase